MADFLLYSVLLCLANLLLAYAIVVYTEGLGYLVLHPIALAGVGAYTYAIFVTSYTTWPPAAAFIAVTAAIIFGGLCAEALRSLRGDGLSLASFGVTVGAVELLRYLDFTGGVYGVTGIRSVVEPGSEIANVLVAIAVGAVATWGIRRWRRSLGGYVCRALHLDEWAAVSLGAPLVDHQRISGLLAGLLAGTAGVVIASSAGYIEPRMFAAAGILVPLSAAIGGGSNTPILVLFLTLMITSITQATRFIGGSATAVGPLSEIVVALILIAVFVVMRLGRTASSYAQE